MSFDPPAYFENPFMYFGLIGPCVSENVYFHLIKLETLKHSYASGIFFQITFIYEVITYFTCIILVSTIHHREKVITSRCTSQFPAR